MTHVTPLANRESDPSWIRTVEDTGIYDLGSGVGPGDWIEITGLSIVVPFRCTPGDRLTGIAELHVINKTASQDGAIAIGFSRNSNEPVISVETIIEDGLDGVKIATSNTEIANLQIGDTISVFARLFFGNNPTFGVDVDASSGETHRLVVTKDVERLSAFEMLQAGIIEAPV